jgi:hypothetical protein
MGRLDRQLYKTANTLDQAFLNDAHDNLVNQLEMICDITAPDGSIIHASDRNKYVGNIFYEALLTFPTIERTLGDWLVSEIQFSEIKIELSNADKRFNRFLPTGNNFESWIGNSIELKIGLRDVTTTYFRIFKGSVTQVGGFGRSTFSITLTARDDYDRLNNSIPTVLFGNTLYPKIQNETAGLFVPLIYGDWRVQVSGPEGSVPAFVTNGLDPLVDRDTSRNASVAIGSPDLWTIDKHFFNSNDAVQIESDGTLPSAYAITTDYFVAPVSNNTFRLSGASGPGAAAGSGSAGSGQFRIKGSPNATPRNVQLTISHNDLTQFDVTQVWLTRGDAKFKIATSDVVNVGSANKSFEILQNTGNTKVEQGDNFLFKPGDNFFVRVKGKYLNGYDDNIIAQAKDLLTVYGGLVAGDFDANWDTFRDKNTPTVDAIANVKSRIWLQEPQSLISYVLSLLEQVRLEAFASRNLKLKLTSLHASNFSSAFASATHTIKNWDVERSSVKIEIDDRNNFNRTKAAYAFLPNIKEEGYFSPIFKNTASIAQVGREISKQVSFPNLYIETDVTNQLIEILRLSSAFFEIIMTTLTWRSLLLEPGDVVKMSLKIGSSQFDNVPVLVRSIGYEPQGLKLSLKLWSFQMVPFAGWAPGFAGIVGGASAMIVQE